MKFNKKEKMIFWYATALGVGGGILGNLWTNTFSELLQKEAPYLTWPLFILLSFMIIWLLYKIFKNLK